MSYAPQHDDHVQRRLAIQAGLLGLASRPNMSAPSGMIHFDEPTWGEADKTQVNIYDHYQKSNWALP